ncbi:MAG: iron-containing alcohol dehydrogenase [Alphaproteobacteria bacterium]|nr:iron-containing alcohol dehydrogenase [Alphaproteobacteria bacterium]
MLVPPIESAAPFAIARLPKIVFGSGVVSQLPGEIARFGQRALIVTGAKSFTGSTAWERLAHRLRDADIAFTVMHVPGEPSPELVDEAVAQHTDGGYDAVVGIGGGSALDAAKAVAGLLKPGNTVMDHLEGVGPELPYAGPATPLICVPTTAGTGSEATKNAVLSRHGADGFKKSFRDDALVAATAIVDPDLLITCPKAVVAANGMDAFTQLLESVVSTRSNPMTEALAWSGLDRFARGFWDMWLAAPEAAGAVGEDTPRAAEARAHMAYASLMSGICLAQTGLGSVHGLAQPLGSLFPIPHGVVCGTLVGDATAINIRALTERVPHSPALAKYARAGALLLTETLTGNAALDGLVRTLRDWTERLGLARLSDYGVTDADVDRIVANSRGSSMKTNPVDLTDGEIAELVRARL